MSARAAVGTVWINDWVMMQPDVAETGMKGSYGATVAAHRALRATGRDV
jgi:hypothetical protein